MSTNGTRTARRSLGVAGLFAGIGGLELGLSRAGHRTLLLCENDPSARAVLDARFPDLEVAPDVRELARLPDGTDLVAAGFPCQDLSQAGDTRGIRGARSGLVAEVFRLLESHDVPWLLLENVPFMLQLARGNAMTFIVRRLEELGFRWAYRVLDTRAFGLPQRRERVFLLASRPEDPAPVLLASSVEPPADEDHRGRACGFYWTEGVRGLGWAVGATPTLKGGSTIGIPSPPAIWMPDGSFVTPDIRDAERLQGFRPNWTKPAERAGRGSFRWKLVGNAVSVPVAKWIGARLADTRPRPSVAPSGIVGASWPRAAALLDGVACEFEVSTWPVRRRGDDLAEFLRFPPKPLSLRASSGFRERFASSTLRAPGGFRAALDQYVDELATSATK